MLANTVLGIQVIDAIGIVGVALIVFGFYRIQIGQWSTRSLWYELDNLVGAALLGFHEFHTEAYISMVLNVLWVFVAIRGITSFVDRYEKHHGKKPFSKSKKSAKKRR